MAFTKRDKRRIVVAGKQYWWVASGNDGGIDLRVLADAQCGQQLHCRFDYHHDLAGNTLTNQLVVTPYIVRQAIELGLSHGWTPELGGGELTLGYVDDRLDLRLATNRADIIRASRRS